MAGTNEMNDRAKTTTTTRAGHRRRLLGGLLAWLALALVSPARAGGDYAAPPAFPDHYKETVVDLRIKVLGGMAGVVRTWYRGRWHFNRAFEPLEIRRDPDGGGILEIVHNGALYEAADSSGRVFTFGNRQRIRVTDAGFRFEDLDGNWVEFDGRGVATVYGDRNNVQVRFGYDANGRRSAVFDHHGNQVLWYEYDAAGKLVRVRDRANREVRYEYDAAGLMTAVVDVSGNRWSYGYSGSGDAVRLTRITNPVGRVVDIAYTSTGMVRSVLDQDGVGARYRYLNDKARRQLNIERHLSGGRVDSLWYNDRSEIERHDVNQATLFEVRSGGREKVIVDRNGGQTVNRYDEFGNLLSRTHADGSTIRFSYRSLTVMTGSTPALRQAQRLVVPSEYVDENGVVTRYEYDAAGNLVRSIEAAGSADERVTEYERDAYGQPLVVRVVADAVTAETVTTFSYDAFGNPVRQVEPEGEVNEYTWDATGALLSHRDGRGKLWSYRRDAAGRLTGLTDPLGNVLQFTYTPMGDLASATDAENHTWVFEHDRRGNLVRITDPDGGVQQLAYDAQDRLIEYRDQEGRSAGFVYDAAGRLLEAVDGAGNRIAREYDDSGEPGAGGFDQAVSLRLPTYVRQRVYDSRNRLVSESADLGGGLRLTSRYEYDAAGNLVSETTPSGARFETGFTARNLPTTLRSPLGDSVRFLYDDLDNLIEFIDANGNRSRFEYDRNGRRLRDLRPLGQERNYSYDAAGNLLSMVNARGQRVEFSYDDANRVTEERHYAAAQDTTPVRTIRYGYDRRGLLTSWSDGQASGSFVYDGNRRLLRGEVDYGGFRRAYQYSYYANGSVKSFTGPDGRVYRFSHDQANRVAAVEIPGEGLVSVNDFRWTEPATVTFPGGGRRQTDYTPLLEPARVQRRDPAGRLLAERAYGYDPSRDVVTVTDDGVAMSYAYDARRRLTGATGTPAGDLAFGYDSNGNRVAPEAGGDSWTYNANDELLARGAVSYAYDADGNRSRREEGGVVRNYRYDARNRLIEVTDGGGAVIARYGYDPFGRRLWKEVGGVRTWFLYTPDGLAAEFAADGSQQRAYLYWPGSRWGSNPLLLRTGGQTYYYNNDHLGAPRELVDRSGRVVWSADYRPWGAALVDASSTVDNPLRLPGQYFDAETGLHYNFHRHYDPEIGRYLQTDPVGLLGGPNPYAYAGNNPANIVDETGLCPPCAVLAREAGKIAGVAGLAAGKKLVGDLLAGEKVFSPGYWKDNWKDYGKTMGKAVGCLYFKKACDAKGKFDKAVGGLNKAIRGFKAARDWLRDLRNPCVPYKDLFLDPLIRGGAEHLKGKIPEFKPFKGDQGRPGNARQIGDELGNDFWQGIAGGAIDKARDHALAL